jgi:integrase
MARKVLTSLKGLLSEALHQDRVAVNVASSVKIGNGSRHKEDVAVPSIADIKAILAKLDELATQQNRRWAEAWERRRALVATAIHTGFRASELRGLPWDAVDLSGGKIEVRQRADENGDIGPPKSKAGRRTVSVPASLVAILRAWKLKAGKHALAFASEEGTPQSLANIYNRAWKPIQIEAGVADPQRDNNGNVLRDKEGKPVMEPRHNFHALRHFHASMLIADGANPKEVQAEMGHNSIQVTYDLYGHLFQDEDAERRRQERSERLAGMLG